MRFINAFGKRLYGVTGTGAIAWSDADYVDIGAKCDSPNEFFLAYPGYPGRGGVSD